MDYPYALDRQCDYENFVATCPKCHFENIYNRTTDLKTLEPVSFKKVECFKCHELFIINYDQVSEPYKYLILDTRQLVNQKRYMYCILNLAQAIECFLSYSALIKLLHQPYKDGILTQEEHLDISKKFNDKTNKWTFAPLRSLFFQLYLNEKRFLSNSEIQSFVGNIPKNLSYKPTDAELKNYSDEKTAELFLKLRETKVPNKRNEVVHKYAYRPSLEEVESCYEETREIVFGLAARLGISYFY
jgi:hypothetical protein